MGLLSNLAQAATSNTSTFSGGVGGGGGGSSPQSKKVKVIKNGETREIDENLVPSFQRAGFSVFGVDKQPEFDPTPRPTSPQIAEAFEKQYGQPISQSELLAAIQRRSSESNLGNIISYTGTPTAPTTPTTISAPAVATSAAPVQKNYAAFNQAPTTQPYTPPSSNQIPAKSTQIKEVKTGEADLSKGTYTIEKGDTLSALARRFGISLQELMRLNPHIVNPNLIYANSALTVPGGTLATQQTGAPAAAIAATQPSIPTSPVQPDALDEVLQALKKRIEQPDEATALKKQLADFIEKRKGSLETLQGYEKEAGLPELRQKYKDFLSKSNEIEAQLEGLPDEMKKKTVDFVVSASQLSRLTAAEAVPLSKLFNSMRRTLDELNTTIGLSEKQVDRYLDANKEDQAALLESMKMKIDAGQDERQAARDAYKDYLELIQTRVALEKSQSPDIESYDEKGTNNTTTRHFFNKKTGRELYAKDMGKTYKVGGGGGGGGEGVVPGTTLTKSQLNQAKGNFFAANPDKMEADFSALSNPEKYAWYQGGPKEETLSENKRKTIGTVRTLKSKGATIEEINTYWLSKGYDIDDDLYEREILDYRLESSKSGDGLLKKIFTKGILPKFGAY